jgi:hypothetical protein
MNTRIEEVDSLKLMVDRKTTNPPLLPPLSPAINYQPPTINFIP